MRTNIILVFLGISLIFFSCEGLVDKGPERTNWVTQSGLSKAEFHDKVLGFLVGSAIGDAMGAPTEMWSREDIRHVYGFVDGLDSMIREKSPEGIWEANLPAGGTTDDTRWKVLTLDYLAREGYELHPRKFARTIHDQFKNYLQTIKEKPEINPIDLENSLMKSQWLLEWDKVSVPYMEENLDGYIDSLGKFYGGEMVCAGLLYSPALGLLYPGEPELAYQSAFRHSIYDLGYAKDLSAISAAMVALAIQEDADRDSLFTSVRLDPMKFFESRLVGRTAYRIWLQAKTISDEAKLQDSLNMAGSENQLNRAYRLLDIAQQDMPFHAGEISLQAYTAMLYSDFEFMPSLIFLVNYGRDNDTTAALVGGILGAFYGFEALPKREKDQVIELSKNRLELDLVKTAQAFTDRVYSNF